MLFSGLAFGQEWYFVKYNFVLDDIKNEKDIENYEFSYIDGVRTNSVSIVFDKESKAFSFSYMTMGGPPILIIERNNDKMYLFCKYKEREIVNLKFKKGLFIVENLNQTEAQESDKSIYEWIINNERKELELVFLVNNEN